MGEKAYRYWMHNLPGVGDRTIEKLLKVFGSAKNVYLADTDALKAVLKGDKAQRIKEFSKRWEIEGRYEEMLGKGISFFSLEEEVYPKRLRALSFPPYALYVMGNLPEDDRPAVAVIGTRECSEYGRYMARAFAGEMAAAGVSVISGMARGIDGIGQMAAVERGGRTYAVLGSGVDVCYPASNKGLYQQILKSGGGILSVFPPGTAPQKNLFPERNRVVAGLADILLVVEARIKSGTWITVDRALEQGKNVYAVPGRLTDRLSDGCNLLIRQGAGIALSPKDMLAEFMVLDNRKGKEGHSDKREKGSGDPSVDGKESDKAIKLLEYLDFYPVSADEILEKVRGAGNEIDMPELLSGLIKLCVEGKVRQAGNTYFEKVCKE